MKRVAIAGYSVEGQASAEYWHRQGAKITVLDHEPKPLPVGFEGRFGPDYLNSLDDFDLIVRTPGLKPWELKTAKPITSGTKEFFDRCAAPIIGVTGTKGKGTASSLIAAILREDGQTVHLGGNIGQPALSFLDAVKPSDRVVLELSSFQLIDLTQSPQTAVVLMIAPDHLNWHKDMAEYVEAKGNLTRHQKAGDLAVFNACNTESVRLGHLGKADKRPYHDAAGVWVDGDVIRMGEEKVMDVSEVGLVGRHNLDNVCASVAATWDIVTSRDSIPRAVKDFRGLPHRLQLVDEVGGIRYYDDSFSTAPDTAIAAIQSFQEPKVLILGGSDKGADYRRLANTVAASDVRKVILAGATGPAIAQALSAAGYDRYQVISGGMDSIMAAVNTAALPGDIVLLSPACASFGLFKDYKDRGDQFAQWVKGLKSRRGESD